jgi:hypothetical protein
VCGNVGVGELVHAAATISARAPPPCAMPVAAAYNIHNASGHMTAHDVIDRCARAQVGHVLWDSRLPAQMMFWREEREHWLVTATREALDAGAAAVVSFLAAVLTEIYLCDVCSCQEILIRNGRG